MLTTVLISKVPLNGKGLNSTYTEYLREWREIAITNSEDDIVAASTCLQGALIDIAQYGCLKHDWLGIIDETLLDGDLPLAYSEHYGKKLFGFSDQYKQVTVHSIYSKWWIECITKGQTKVDHSKYAKLILDRKSAPDGLIYDWDLSPTVLRHRMKTELMMSAALALDILHAARKLSLDFSQRLATTLVDPKKCPRTRYMSAEYFRSRALSILGYEQLFPVNIENAIEECTKDLSVGYCDFPMDSKVDAYMGTAKRTGHDKPIHSPLTACHTEQLSKRVGTQSSLQTIRSRLKGYAAHLRSNPLDIPAFQMRDVCIPFGSDTTPIEIICASYWISKSFNG